MKILELAFTACPVTDFQKSRAFYEGILGLVPSEEPEPEPKWIEYEIGPHTFALGKFPDWNPSSEGVTVGFEVDDFDKTIAHLREHGVEFQDEPFDTPVCHMALVFDPDKNLLIIHKRKS